MDQRRGWIAVGKLMFIALAAALMLAACGGAARIGSGDAAAQSSGASSKDWLYVGHDRNNDRFAPETQINRSNVSKLTQVWSAGVGPQQFLMESFPVEVGGVAYVTTSTDQVLAFKATTGKLIWRYAPSVNFSLSTGVGGYGVSVNRGIAVSGKNVYVVSFDDKLHALSKATGEQLWSSEITSTRGGAYETTGPTVWNNTVFVGDSGSEDGVRGFVAAFNATTGKQLWKFYTVPKPGTGWVPKNGGGGTVYFAPTVDATTGTVYVGTGNPSPTIVGKKRPGPDLYTDSVLALNARTGKLLWYHQEIPHDLWDYDAESPVVIFNAKAGGRTIRAVGEAGKSGYYFVLNAKTGHDIFPRLAFVKEHHSPPTSKGTVECPGAVGGSQYSPVAYSPQTSAAYVSGINLCMILTVTPNGAGTGEKDFGGLRTTLPNQVPTGTFSAVNLKTGKFLWHRKMPTPMIGGSAATAGGLVFTGDQHGNFYALDAKTGEILWKHNVGLAFGSAPIVYQRGGREYVLAAVGGGALTASAHLGPIGARVVAFALPKPG
jgi:PQQ-dependent dehydrogenase (methanol/ethanol family)